MMIGCAAMIVSATAFAVLVVIELVARMLPLLILIAAAWLVIRLARRKPRFQEPSRSDQAAVAAAAVPSSSPASTPVMQGHFRALPPVTAGPERRYVIAGEDAGFNADRADGYLRLNPPRVAGTPHARPHQNNNVRQLPARRRAHRAGTTRP